MSLIQTIRSSFTPALSRFRRLFLEYDTDLISDMSEHDRDSSKASESGRRSLGGAIGDRRRGRGKNLLGRLVRQYQFRIALEMKNWKSAVTIAEDPIRPRRETLYELYHSTMDDSDVTTQRRTAINTLQLGDFQIRKGEKTDEKLKKLFKRPWFSDYLEHALDTELYGHSLVEFDSKMIDGEFQGVHLIPREHVRPESREVVLWVHDEKGFDYTKPPLNKYLVDIGRGNDLGLLRQISRVVIRKEYALTDWSRRNERYGMPLLVIKTASRTKEELDSKQKMAENFGVNSWAILDDDDQFELKESTQAFAYQTFKDYADRCDKKIAQMINGQTGTTEEKAFVGSAEVHERILNDYTLSRMQRIQNHINYALIPFLIRHGYPLAGCEFQFTDLVDEEKKEKKPRSQDSPAEPGPSTDLKKKARV